MQWSDAVMMVYGMGLTQQVVGVHNVHMVANLALLRGNIGKPARISTQCAAIPTCKDSAR
jgi:anaerobic selenocysteine-containing dehydrogenase